MRRVNGRRVCLLALTGVAGIACAAAVGPYNGSNGTTIYNWSTCDTLDYVDDCMKCCDWFLSKYDPNHERCVSNCLGLPVRPPTPPRQQL